MARNPLIVLIGGLVGLAVAASQTPEYQLKMEVPLVSLDVQLMDIATGRVITNLVKDDFTVFEDGKPQDIRNFSPADTPYNVLAMFDCTGSIRNQWSFLNVAMRRFTETLRPQDRIRIAAFGTGAETLRDWTPRNQLRTDFQIPTNSQVCAGTDFYGAMSWAANAVRGIDGRKGIVVFSDGLHERIPKRPAAVGGLPMVRFVDAADDLDFQAVLKSVRASGALFYFVAVNTDLNPAPVDELLHAAAVYSPIPIYNMQQVRLRMELLAQESGGRIVFPKGTSDYVKLFEQIATELGSSYSLGYAPPNPSGVGLRHQIEVRIKNKTLRIQQSRDSYVVR